MSQVLICCTHELTWPHREDRRSKVQVGLKHTQAPGAQSVNDATQRPAKRRHGT